MGKIKVKQLYAMDSFAAAVAAAKTFDGAAGLLLPRQLEHISSTIYQQKFAELTLLSQAGVSVNNEGGSAEFITKLKRGITGDFETSGNDTDTDGKISLTTESDTIPVIMKKAESSWTEIELEQAKVANQNLVGDMLGAHNTRYNQLIDKIGYVGTDSIEGLLNFSGFTSDSSANTFDNLTGLQQYNEIRDLVNAQRATVSNDPVFGANKVAISPETFNIINGTFIDTTGTVETVRTTAERNLNIEFVITFRAADVGGAKVLVAYSDDERAMIMRIPTPLRVSNIYQKGFSSYVESLFRVGGLDVIENGSGYILTGV
jgi:hypothetical protein